jgi:hypothetical protein
MIVALSVTGLAPASASSGRPPVLAYYYIWYNQASWGHGKSDYPALGRYNSGDANIMRQQIELAKGAGIDGFIVSWKEAPDLDARLATLVQLAQQEHFKLSVIYEALDYNRQPLPAAKVGSDLQWFAARYSNNPVFNLFGKPLVIWSGTWMFSPSDIQKEVAPVSNQLQVLASEKDTSGYQRLAASVAGDAYYWSSVNPSSNPGYGVKLHDMANIVHADHGLWIAPFAPGFDARDVGGHDVVSRNDGDTLRTEYSTAVTSSPDALGLISWNEYSENSEVEPSHNTGTLYLRVLRQLTHGLGPSAAELGIDSSDSSGSGGGGLALPLLGLLAILVLVTIVGIRMRGGRNDNDEDEPPPPPPRRRVSSGKFRAVMRRRGLGLIVVMLVALVPAGATVIPSDKVTETPRTTTAVPASAVAHYMGHMPPAGKTTITIAAAGDIACTAGDPDAANAPLYKNDVCKQQTTANLITKVIHPDAVLPLGDNTYPSGSFKGFEQLYDPTWGKLKAITYPVPGNHEYGTPGASGYFAYFGKAAGMPGQGWYSYNIGDWHMVALNSECEDIGGCGRGSPEESWLRADLAAHPAACTLAYWHKPRWSSGTHHSNAAYNVFWQDLYAGGADLVLVGHDHDYERFAPLDPSGKVDNNRGVREIVAGTGGDSHYLIHTPVNGSQRRIQGIFGVLDLTLQPHGYSWKFLAEPGAGVLDSGLAACH